MPIRSIVLIVFVLIDAIYSVDRVGRIKHINPDVFNCSALQLKDNSNDPIKSGMAFWGKKGENFDVTDTYWHLQRFHEVCLRNKYNSLRDND